MSAAVIPERRTGRGVAAVVVAFVTVFVLSLGTDQVLHVLKVYPPWGEPMNDNGLNALALSYRIVFGILGSYIAASIASHAPMRYAMMVGWIGVVLSTLGLIGAMKVGNLGPLWYPAALVVTAVPCAWIGGWLSTRRAR